MVKLVYYKACHRFICDRSIELQKLVNEWIKHHLNSHASMNLNAGGGEYHEQDRSN